MKNYNQKDTTIKRLHYFSGITITMFISFHLLNHSFSIFGADKHIEVMNYLRIFYRNTFAEIILLSAVLIQIASGIKLFINKRKIATTFFDKLQIWTGLYLAVFLAIHLTAIFSGRILLQLDTNFYFGVAGLNTFPYSLFFAPYYGLAIVSFFGHLAAVHNSKMNRTIFGMTPKNQAFAILAFGLISTLVIFYGLTNHFNGVKIPGEYNALIGR